MASHPTLTMNRGKILAGRMNFQHFTPWVMRVTEANQWYLQIICLYEVSVFRALQSPKFYGLLADYFTQGYPWRCLLFSQKILIQIQYERAK